MLKEMGRKVNWFHVVKEALGSESKEHKGQRSSKSKEKWFVKKKKRSYCVPNSSMATMETAFTTTNATKTLLPPTAVPPGEVVKQPLIIPSENVKLKEEDKQKKRAQSIAVATAEVVRLISASQFTGKSKEEVAAIRIQTAFRGYLARRALGALQGLNRLKIVMQGHSIKCKTTDTCKSMQTLAFIQSRVRARRLRMSDGKQRLLLDERTSQRA